jgi:hypothetical protein
MASFLTKKSFTEQVEEEVYMKDITYMEAANIICEMYDIEISEVKKFISDSIRSKIEAEARDLNFLPKKAKLSFE